jgi:dTDP-4-amino-4,6-dideoxygalactose transaminase
VNRGNELPPTAGLPLRLGDFARTPSRSFTRGLSDFFGIPDPILTCSGTAAMVIVLSTLHGREPARNEVVVPAYTCPLVVLAVKLVPGLVVISCDTLPNGIDFDPDRLKSLCGPKTLAVVPTHLGGRVADVATAKAIAAFHGAAVLEDAAQALGATSDGQSVGLAADAGFFSLAAGKGLTTYEGGILCAADPVLRADLEATACRLLVSNVYWSLRRLFELFGYAVLYRPSFMGLAYGRNLKRMLDKGDEEKAVGDYFTLADIPLHSLDQFRQRVAANALERLPEFLVNGSARAEKRIAALQELEGVRVVTERADRFNNEGVWPFLLVLMPGRQQRDKALAKLWRAGLGVTKLFVRALPDYPFLTHCFERGYADCPNARDLADKMLTITNSQWLGDEDFARILATLKECL